MDCEAGDLKARGQSALPMLTVAKAAARTLLKDLPWDADIGSVCIDLNPYVSKEVISFRTRLAALPTHERNYWIGTLYTLMMSPADRRAQAAYFTPPYLADAVIDMAVDHGFDVARHDVLDPAAGGAAFLSLIADRMYRAGLPKKTVTRRLNGIEIDERLARMSEFLIAEQLEGFKDREIVKVRDSIHVDVDGSYDLVIANPPYGRMRPDEVSHEKWSKVAYGNHINKYAIFTELCIRVAKPGGLVALVIPSSFRGGPLYDRMRSYIASQGQILALGAVTNRDDVFADVAQDVSVLLMRKGIPHRTKQRVKFPAITGAGISHPVPAGLLPEDMSSPWLAGADARKDRGGAKLSHYGVTAKAGYFVWNRSWDRTCKADDDHAYPLIWAKNVRSGSLCRPVNRGGDGVDFVRVEQGSTAIVTGPAAIVQRITNSSQPRRIVAATVDQDSIARWKGFVSENHTIVLSGSDADGLNLLVSLLNTKAVDERYRAVSGTATVSVMLLRELDLPSPDAMRAALRITEDIEEAAVIAYRNDDLQEFSEAS
ncbi:N-6 DNA methylase [Sinorhizobium meliloti]|nr:N-6 DNA methylase [Sinorhizobium meliloti]MDE3854974.1 N-6 DNA methylase [Sinorhizobium meliloti]MDW9394326.1 N-6 DNA methylase [Sinorhizobium meliloti]MDW9430940.1 N-6 DNA methylase [Sinorhizobium meliloti]MDW9438691.1 N-6 DNA methylase [Sinorhizobium meliloti]